jgi:hypothetical protein
MKKIIYLAMSALISIAIAAGAVLNCADVSSFLIRSFGNFDLKKKGILIEYAYVAPGLHQRPFIIPFTETLRKFSLGRLDLDVINTYTVGNYDKDPRSRIPSASNFLDPTSKFKDSWFGVYLIFDDPEGRAKKFLLKNPMASPADPSNFKGESLLELPRIDQMIVVNSTHQNEEGYNYSKFIASFPIWTTCVR